MKTFLQIAAVLGVLAALSYGVTAESPHQSSSAPDTSPFELVQSTALTKIMIRVNKFTGDAWYLLDGKKGNGPAELAWVSIAPPVVKNAAGNGEPRFRVYISGEGLSAAYLLDVRSGETWVLSGDPGPRVDPKLRWVPVMEP